MKTQAARISRKATSVALKCTRSKQLLDDFKKAIDKLDLEADNTLSKMEEKSSEVPLVSAECATNTINDTISFRVPQVVKGAKCKGQPSPSKKRNGRKIKC